MSLNREQAERPVELIEQLIDERIRYHGRSSTDTWYGSDSCEVKEQIVNTLTGKESGDGEGQSDSGSCG